MTSYFFSEDEDDGEQQHDDGEPDMGRYTFSCNTESDTPWKEEKNGMMGTLWNDLSTCSGNVDMYYIMVCSNIDQPDQEGSVATSCDTVDSYTMKYYADDKCSVGETIMDGIPYQECTDGWIQSCNSPQ